MRDLEIHGVTVRVRGMAGHFIAAHSCAFRLHCALADLRVSTVGLYFPREGKLETVGCSRVSELMVFREGPLGDVLDWGGVGMVSAGMTEDTVTMEALHWAVVYRLARAYRRSKLPALRQSTIAKCMVDAENEVLG